jgi:hypothetical protein
VVHYEIQVWVVDYSSADGTGPHVTGQEYIVKVSPVPFPDFPPKGVWSRGGSGGPRSGLGGLEGFQRVLLRIVDELQHLSADRRLKSLRRALLKREGGSACLRAVL